MFDEPDETPAEKPFDPLVQAREKFDEFRMHAELAAIFEGNRKFAAEILPGFDRELARDIQKNIARLEKSKSPDSPILPEPSAADAAGLLKIPTTRDVSTNDYHIHRRPGEVMIVRWLDGGLGGATGDDQVETFYKRMQAHFDAALNQYREEERQSQGWKQDPKTIAYLDALDKIDVRMADRYLREPLRTLATLGSEGSTIQSPAGALSAFALSTQSADELDILHLCDYLMGVPAAEIVGEVSAPSDEPTESDRAWFFKLFSLRGVDAGVERMCFFTYLQKSDDSAW